MDPCDALGRARDELYTVLAEKEKIQAQSQTLVGELQATVKQNAEAHERIDLLVKQIERRIHSLEQPGVSCVFPSSFAIRKWLKWMFLSFSLDAG